MGTIRYWQHILTIMLGTLSVPVITYAQSSTGVRLTIVPVSIETSGSETVSLVIIVENTADQVIVLKEITLADENLRLTEGKALPQEVDARSSATGFYRVTIPKRGQTSLVASLSYMLGGREQLAVTQAKLERPPFSPNLLRDIFLILAGALTGLLGSLLTEWSKGRLEQRGQAERGLDTLIFALGAAQRAVEQNRTVPIELWQEYHNEGRHSALARKAAHQGETELIAEIVRLYARLLEYNEARQHTDRAELAADLANAQTKLNGLA